MAIIGSGIERGGKDLSIKPPVAADGCKLQMLCPLMFSIFSSCTYVASTYVTSTDRRVLRISVSLDIGPTDARVQTPEPPSIVFDGVVFKRLRNLSLHSVINAQKESPNTNKNASKSTVVIKKSRFSTYGV